MGLNDSVRCENPGAANGRYGSDSVIPRPRLNAQCPLSPIADFTRIISRGPLRANKRHRQRSKQQRYSITSSARPSSAGGMVTPIALAVVTLTISSTLVGNSIGRSPAFTPFNILSTK